MGSLINLLANDAFSFDLNISPGIRTPDLSKTKVIHLRLRYTAPETGGDPSVNRFASVPIFCGHDNQALFKSQFGIVLKHFQFLCMDFV